MSPGRLGWSNFSSASSCTAYGGPSATINGCLRVRCGSKCNTQLLYVSARARSAHQVHFKLRLSAANTPRARAKLASRTGNGPVPGQRNAVHLTYPADDGRCDVRGADSGTEACPMRSLPSSPRSSFATSDVSRRAYRVDLGQPRWPSMPEVMMIATTDESLLTGTAAGPSTATQGRSARKRSGHRRPLW